jgi:hypothetical protein
MVLIVTVVVGAWSIELDSEPLPKNPFTKEMEFSDTTFREVDQLHLQGVAYGTDGVRDSGVLRVANFEYANEEVESLVANQGTYIGSIIYLEGDVRFRDTQGYHCTTEQAEYDQRTSILNITAPYEATHGKNRVVGDTLTYHTKTKESYGTVIDAIYYTVDK